MTDEYLTAVTEFNLTWEELVTMGRNSLKWSFTDPALKARLLADYDRDVKAFESKFAGDDWTDRLKSVKPVSYGFAKRRWGISF
jgi:adenosine deaminase CECR1